MKHVYAFPQVFAGSLASWAGLWLALATLLSGPVARAQAPVPAPAWQSAISVATSTGYAEVRAMATDAAGNVYLAGGFEGTVQIGTTTLTNTTTLLGDNRPEIFVAKWNSASRTFGWAVQAGGANMDFPTALVVSGTSVYVAGMFFSATANFGSITLTNASSNQEADLFVAKLTDAGTSASFVWAQGAGGTGAETVNALALSGSSLYLAGTFSSTSLTLGGTTLSDRASEDVFVAKLTDNGATSTFAWAVRGGGANDDEAMALAVSGTSLYLGGNFNRNAVFGTQNLAVTSVGGVDIFMAKLTDAGSSASYDWVKTAGSTGSDYIRALATNGGASVYLAGDFDGANMLFGNGIVANATDTGSTDGFVAKLLDSGSTGDFGWAMRLGSSDYDAATALAVRGAHVYVAGHFASANIILGATYLTNSGPVGTPDLFLTHILDTGTRGTFVWGQQAGSPGNDYAHALAIAGTSLYLGGSVRLPAMFSSQGLAGPSTTGAAFFATLNDAINLASAAAATPAGYGAYPNPAHGTALVPVPAATSAMPATLTLLDDLGRVARTAQAPAGATYPLDLAGLAPGLYALRVQVGETQAVQRLVVE